MYLFQIYNIFRDSELLLQESPGVEHDMNITHSEYEEGSEEKKEESEDEEEVNGVDRVDLAVQTSLMDSPSPSRCRGQRLAITSNSLTSQGTSYTTTPTFPITSPYLR